MWREPSRERRCEQVSSLSRSNGGVSDGVFVAKLERAFGGARRALAVGVSQF